MGNIPLHATGRRKIATTLQRVDGTLLCALIHPGPMLQSSSRNDDAERTDYPNGFHTHLDRKHDEPDFRHRLPDSRLSSVQQAQGQHEQTGHSPCPGFHRMAAMLESPPYGSVLSGRQHPADSLHQRVHYQYDNNDIGLYIRLLHNVSGDKNYRMYRAINTNSRIYRLQKVLSVLQKENCNTLQILPKNTRNLQYTANFPKKFRIFAAHFIFSNQDRMQNE